MERGDLGQHLEQSTLGPTCQRKGAGALVIKKPEMRGFQNGILKPFGHFSRHGTCANGLGRWENRGIGQKKGKKMSLFWPKSRARYYKVISALIVPLMWWVSECVGGMMACFVGYWPYIA